MSQINSQNVYVSNKDCKRLKINQDQGLIICNKSISEKNINWLLQTIKSQNPDHDIKLFKTTNGEPAVDSIPVDSLSSKPISPNPTITVLLLGTNTKEQILDWLSIVNIVKSENNKLQQLLESKPSIVVCNLITENSKVFKQLLKTVFKSNEFSNPKETDFIKYILRVSHSIQHSELKSFVGISQLKRYLISRLKILETGSKENKLIQLNKWITGNTIPQEIISPIPTNALSDEIKSLKVEHCIAKWNEFELYIIDFNKAPNCMLEIGRLRELTFRNAKEGTGFVVDLDSYDPIYKHLFVWDSAKLKIVGGYRFAEGHQIIPNFGKKGFYISSLFKIKTEFTETLLQTVELGRSFIIPEYQKSNFLLLLMWKALYQYIFKDPRNRYIIGPVSISQEYSKISRLLIIDYLSKYYKHKEFSPFIKPRKPFKFVNIRGTENIIIRNFEQDIQKFDQLISEIQADAIKLPVLLRQYLKQNAKVLAFNKDPKFQNVLDALLILDYQEINTEFKHILDNTLQTENTKNIT